MMNHVSFPKSRDVPCSVNQFAPLIHNSISILRDMFFPDLQLSPIYGERDHIPVDSVK